MDAPASWPMRITLGVAAFFVSIVATYAFLRGRDVLFASEANPATVLYMYGGKIAMFWRALVGAYVGGGASLIVVFLARTRSKSVVRGLGIAVPVVAGLATVQALLLP
ncbi:hypothetical protein BH09MYX1_BH09MYX1_20010 [soil metagenome]